MGPSSPLPAILDNFPATARPADRPAGQLFSKQLPSPERSQPNRYPHPQVTVFRGRFFRSLHSICCARPPGHKHTLSTTRGHTIGHRTERGRLHFAQHFPPNRPLFPLLPLFSSSMEKVTVSVVNVARARARSGGRTFRVEEPWRDWKYRWHQSGSASGGGDGLAWPSLASF